MPVAVLGKLRQNRLVPAVRSKALSKRAPGAAALATGAPAAVSGEVARPGGSDEGKPVSPSAIEEYSSLAASQVVPRLAALDQAELHEVFAYESATRRRRTILAAVDSLRQ